MSVFGFLYFLISISIPSHAAEESPAKPTVETISLASGEINFTKIGSEVFIFLGGGVELDRAKASRRVLDGKDNRATDVALAEALKKHQPFKQVMVGISSFGGHLDVAYKIQSDLELLQKSGVVLTTFVPDGAICVSSCLTLFMAAPSNRRFAGRTARFAVHACSSEISCDRKTTEKYLANLKAHGLSNVWLTKNSEVFSSANANELTQNQLLSSNIVKFFYEPDGWAKVRENNQFQHSGPKMLQYYESFQNSGMK